MVEARENDEGAEQTKETRETKADDKNCHSITVRRNRATHFSSPTR